MDHLTSIVANNKFRDPKEGTDLSRTVDKVQDFVVAAAAVGALLLTPSRGFCPCCNGVAL